MKKNVDIAVSTDPIEDLQDIVEYAKEMQGVAEFLHCDIMKENFVEKETYDCNVVKTINRHSAIMLDVHLMEDEPSEDIKKYIDAGANILTVHYEAFEDKDVMVSVLEYVKSKGVLAGISLKPSTPFKEIRTYVFNADIVLVMGVEPGASGQPILEETFDKVSEIDKFRRDNNLRFKIEFDGGVNDKTAPKLIERGVDILVSGSFVYGSENRKKAVEQLKNNK